MKSMKTKVLAALAAVSITGTLSWSAGIWQTLPIVGGASYCASSNVAGPAQTGITGAGGGVAGAGVTTGNTICGQTVPAGPPALTGNEVIPADLYTPGTQQMGGGPATALIPVPALGNFWATPRNYLRNGALDITNTNGTSAVTCATTSALTTAALSADRWGCDVNVGSGNATTTIVTSSPSPPTGFTNSMKVVRAGGSLAQPVCVMQEVPTAQTTELAGQVVTFSSFVTGLAGLAADNGGNMNLVLFYGTGTDQKLSVGWTASPAITLAFTNVATIVNQQFLIVTTPVPALTFQRISVSATVPSTATELVAALCFTPSTGATGGATDGFAFTGAQLERSPVMSNYEFSPKSYELSSAQQFFYKISEGAATTVRAMCMASSTTLAICGLQFPETMYLTPTMGYTTGFATATTTAGSTLGACTTLRTSTLVTGNGPSTNGVMLDCVATTVPAAGSADYLADNGGSGVITAWTGL